MKPRIGIFFFFQKMVDKKRVFHAEYFRYFAEISWQESKPYQLLTYSLWPHNWEKGYTMMTYDIMLLVISRFLRDIRGKAVIGMAPRGVGNV
jgi:hypothetical protein